MPKRWLSTAAFALALLVSRDAVADTPWVERPLTLLPLHFSADAAIGVGQYDVFTKARATASSNRALGWGLNLETAMGLPLLCEIGVRIGYRFGDAGAAAQADRGGRLFDSIVNDAGQGPLSNPEVFLRGTVFSIERWEIGLEMRILLPAAGPSFVLSPGVPVRLHVSRNVRVDTGLSFPIALDRGKNFAVEVPVQVFLQVGNGFFGPLTGLSYGKERGARIMAGAGGGYTIGGRVDLKVQVFTDRINDVRAQHLGGGIGLGLRVP